MHSIRVHNKTSMNLAGVTGALIITTDSGTTTLNSSKRFVKCMLYIILFDAY